MKKQIKQTFMLILFMIQVQVIYCQIASGYEIGLWRGFTTAAVSYTWDDNTVGQFTIAQPIFDKYGFKTTFFVITNSANIDWGVLQNAADNGHEVGSHSVTHPDFGKIDENQRLAELQGSKDAINANVSGQECLTLAYPFCQVGDYAQTESVYISARICSNGIEMKTPVNFMRVNSVNCGSVGPIRTSVEFENWVNQTNKIEYFLNGWVVFMLHGVDDAGGYSPVDSAELDAHLNYMSQNKEKFWVATYAEVVKYIKERDNVSLVELTNNSNEISFRLTHDLDNHIYNTSLSVKRKIPTEWLSPSVTQNGKLLDYKIIEEGLEKFIIFDALPNEGIVSIIVAPRETTWLGTIDNDWSNTGNWSGNALPTGIDNIIISSTSENPILNTSFSLSEVGTIAINSSAILTVNEGVILTNAGTITNNGSIVLKSSNLGTGYLVSNGGSSVANVTQERYLTSNQRGWRLLSNPLATTTFGTLASNSLIDLGPNASGSYDSATDTWTSGLDTDDMVSQQAYKVFLRGLASEVDGLIYNVPTPTNVTISTIGTANNTAPSSIATVASKFYLVANPYTAPVSVASIIGASTGLSNSVSYYNPTKASTDVKIKAGGYDPITVAGVSGSATDVVLPPMGAIFVQATSNGTINIPKTAIYSGTVTSPAGNFAHKTSSTKDVAPVALTVNVNSNGIHYDKLKLRFKEVGTTGSNIDFGKLPNTILDFYSIGADSKNMAVSELELTAQTILLGISSSALQSFTFNIEENSIPIEFDVVLEDKVLNTKTVLTTGANYDFTIDNTAASQGAERFAITIKASGLLAVEDVLATAIKIWPNPTSNQFHILNNQNEENTTFEIYTITGQLIYSQQSLPKTTITIQTHNWAAGVYLLKAINKGNITTKKLIIQ